MQRPISHRAFFAVTLVLVCVVIIVVALPTGPIEDPWRTFADDRTLTTVGARSIGSPVPGTDWRISAANRSATGRHRRYEQRLSGRRVLGAWAIENDLEAGRRRSAGRFVSPETETKEGEADSVTVRRIADAWLGEHALRADARWERVWRVDEGRLHPASIVILPAAHPIGDWRVVVDERSLEVIEGRDILSRGTGDLFARVPALPCGHGPATDADLIPFIERLPLPHLDGSGYLDGTYVRVVSGTSTRVHEPSGLFAYPPSHPGFEQVTAYHTVTAYFDYIESIGVTAYGGRRVLVDAHGYAGDNSFFSPATGRISLGDGGVPDGQDPEIILHELGHALHHRAQPKYAETDASRAVSEGIADYLACSYFEDPLLAEWDASAYSSACPPHLRRLDTPRRYPDDLTGQVHEDGLLLATALWAVREELGAEWSDRILLESLFFLTPESDVLDAARLFSETAGLLYGEAIEAEARSALARYGFDADQTSVDIPSIVARVSPNPFRSSSAIRFTVSTPGEVRVSIHDVQGREVRRLLQRRRDAGSHAVEWDGTDEAGRRLPAGIYFYRVAAGTSLASGKLVYLR